MNSPITYIKHYLYGLVASSWNAGITSVKIAGGMSVAADVAPKAVTAPDLHALGGIFIAAAAWEVIDYLSKNPLPIALPDEIPDVAVGKPAVAAPALPTATGGFVGTRLMLGLALVACTVMCGIVMTGCLKAKADTDVPLSIKQLPASEIPVVLFSYSQTNKSVYFSIGLTSNPDKDGKYRTFHATREPVVTKDADGWVITFKDPGKPYKMTDGIIGNVKAPTQNDPLPNPAI